MARILCVDDDPDVCDVIALYVEELGHSSVKAHNAAEARIVLAKAGIDLLITDAALPGPPSDQGLALAAHATTLGVPAFLVSGNPSRQKQIFESRVPYPMLKKPFSLANMEAAITASLVVRRSGEAPSAGS